MKRSYAKPVITFESLAVSANISTGCALVSTNSAPYICPVKDEESDWTIFNDSANCIIIPGPNDTICYDIPFANTNVFES